MRICEGYGGAEHANFRALRKHCKSACNYRARGHQAVKRRVVFVDDQAVVAEPIGEHEFVNIVLVELVADLRIEPSIGDIDPLPLRSTWSDIGIRHEVHKIELQGS